MAVIITIVVFLSILQCITTIVFFKKKQHKINAVDKKLKKTTRQSTNAYSSS